MQMMKCRGMFSIWFMKQVHEPPTTCKAAQRRGLHPTLDAGHLELDAALHASAIQRTSTRYHLNTSRARHLAVGTQPRLLRDLPCAPPSSPMPAT